MILNKDLQSLQDSFRFELTMSQRNSDLSIALNLRKDTVFFPEEVYVFLTGSEQRSDQI